MNERRGCSSNYEWEISCCNTVSSTRFIDEFIESQKRLTFEGNIATSVGLFGHLGDDDVWENMDEGAFTKIIMQLQTTGFIRMLIPIKWIASSL